jgi:hypothetical protein
VANTLFFEIRLGAANAALAKSTMHKVASKDFILKHKPIRPEISTNLVKNNLIQGNTAQERINEEMRRSAKVNISAQNKVQKNKPDTWAIQSRLNSTYS